MLSYRLPQIIALFLFAIISGGVYIQLSPLFFAPDVSTNITTPKNSGQTVQQTESPKSTHNIASFKLFGDAKKIIEKPKVVSKDLPKTKLRLTLTGVMASGQHENASALVEGPDKETLNYRIDDELPGGAILKQVYNDRIVIERAGRLENLVFVEKRPIGIETYEPPEEDSEEFENTVSSSSTPPPTTRAGNPGRTQGIKDRLSKLRKRMLKNRSSL